MAILLELKRLGSTHNPVVSQLLSRSVVGVSTVQTLHLCLQDLLPTSAYRDILRIPKPCHLRQSIDKSLSTNDLQPTCHKKEVKQKHTSLQISVQADLLTVILAAYSSSEPTTHDPTVKLQLCMTTPHVQIQSFPTAMQTVRSSHEQRRPSRLPKELFLLSLLHFKLGLKNYT